MTNYAPTPPAEGEKIIQDARGALRVPDGPIVPFIEGDGTGPDIWAAAVRVFDAAVCKAVDHATGAKAFLEFGILGVIYVLWFFFGIQMVQIAKKFIKSVICRQMYVLITQMIFTKLSCHVSHRL